MSDIIGSSIASITWPDPGPQYRDLVRRVESLTARVEDLEACNRPIDPPGCGACNRYHYGACDPEPVPEWRRLVDVAWHPSNMPSQSDALGVVLDELSRLALSKSDSPPIGCLARIVAVCEAQVGDGWQADPPCTVLDGMNDCPEAHSDGRCCIYCLIDSFTAADEWKWKHLGTRAAAWLRDLTEATP